MTTDPTDRHYDREFVRTFFTSPTAVEGGDDSAKMLRSAAQLRGTEAPDVWVPDNEDATAPSMRDQGVENVVEVVSEHGADFPGEIHPRVVWHRDDPATRYRGFQHVLAMADPERGAVDHLDGFVIPEVGDLDDWKKADEALTVVETEHGLDEGSLSMSVIIESGEAELAMGDLRAEMGNPSNNLERLFLLVDGEVDYTKDMRAMTPTGELPEWPELRHNTSRGASAAGLVAVDGPFDDIRDVEGYRDRMTENRAKGMTGIWSLTPGQVVEANTEPLPPASGYWLLDDGESETELRESDGRWVYDGDALTLEESGDGYVLRVDGREHELSGDDLREELLGRASYVPSMADVVDSMEEFEAAKEAGKGAIAMTRAATLGIDDLAVDVEADRMWDEATYQAAKTPIDLFQDVYEHRPDQHDALADRYGGEVVERATALGI
jgi:bifunctional (S)-malyl-CoA lyase/thioesterase